MVYRVFVEKKPELANDARSLLSEAKQLPGVEHLERVRILNRYDVEHITPELFDYAVKTVFSEPQVDLVTREADTDGASVFAVEYLPGQFDQRADSAAQCIQIISQGERPDVRTARVYLLYGALTDAELAAVKKHVINPVDSREASLALPETLEIRYEIPTEVETLTGFCARSDEELAQLIEERGLAMDLDDIRFCRDYFRTEQRDPTITELRMIDTYWSDHCRHTTFSTTLDCVTFEDPLAEKTYQDYLKTREQLGRTKPVNLMDVATLAVKYLRRTGKLDKLDESEEINACTVKITVEVDGKAEPWLLLFKNETHNHPTEIEPFGGAATCIGGAIRDPLSGRSYVYQAMRITGAGDITKDISETMEHKLPQSRISKGAAAGYSSYGNQIGLATTYVKEIYDEGYVAKRMEVGAVVGAAPKANVKREKPCPGDIVVLIGGATGRDGVGGATGSSKEHNDTSLTKCSSEVQKGNAPIERKLQRLFRNPKATRMIKKANDFGAGGVSVAVGELADGLNINLDSVPVKYAGLSGTELAISESQERMAVLIEKNDFEAFRQCAYEENLDACIVAEVTEEPRLVMYFQGEKIVDMSRAFLDTNGVRGVQDVEIAEGERDHDPFAPVSSNILDNLRKPNVACQIGMAEMFDASIGKSTVLMPFGGKYQLTETEGSVQKLPVFGFTNTCSIMTHGYDPDIARFSPYLGASYSVVEALARVSAMGGDYRTCRLSNQEYFERLHDDPQKWGKPMQALLGLIEAQRAFETPSIGGKDSMSGTFNQLHVPPTLITFAVTTAKSEQIISPEFKKAGNYIYVIAHHPHADHTPDYTELKSNFDKVRELIRKGTIVSASTVKFGGIAEAVCKMSFGNHIGAACRSEASFYDLMPGSIVVEAYESILDDAFTLLGITTEEKDIVLNDEKVSIDAAIRAWRERYEAVYPVRVDEEKKKITTPEYVSEQPLKPKQTIEHPKVIIPVFPGQNCEYDTAQQFERAGAIVETYVFNNLNVESIERSLKELSEKIASAQILMVVGGFSSGDEPDGSGKFIANVLSNPQVNAAVQTLLANDGLILGICNGFQALIKSGLLPYGDISSLNADSPTLFRNDINRHVSHMAKTKITSNKSPWLAGFTPGECHSIAMSHGEGKFVVSEEMAKALFENGQVATQYVDEDGDPTMNGEWNINGSSYAIEGITSPDGRILGKMGHSERYEEGLFQNIDGNKEQNIFANGVNYFRQK